MERRKFEEGFQDAFKNAGVEPSDRVWTNIELDLIKAEGEKMKRRVLFYQILAAASISFAVIFAGIGVYVINDRESAQIALLDNRTDSDGVNSGNTSSPSDVRESKKNESSAPSESTADPKDPLTELNRSEIDKANPVEPSIHKNGSRKNDPNTSQQNLANDHTDANANRNNLINSNSTSGVAHKNSISQNKSTEREGLSDAQHDVFVDEKAALDNVSGGLVVAGAIGSAPGNSNLPALYTPTVPKLTFEKNEVVGDPVALMFQRLNDLEKELAQSGSQRKRKNEEAREKLWTSVGFAAGAFNSLSPSAGAPSPQSSASTNLASSSVVQNQTKASGVSYALGLTLGGQISDRWVIQGGLNYLTEMSDYTSTQAIQQSNSFKAASVNEYRKDASLAADEKFVPTAPYTVNNSNEYITIPMQAGYLLVKRKLVWQLNAGISTDLFIQNTIDAEGNIQETTSSAGDDSPFRTVNFSGLVGSELSYRFGGHYRVGLNPGLRYPLNSIYKDNLGLDSTPLTFDIGLRFRYIFR